MNKIGILKNEILGYEWGSYTYIPELLGENFPSRVPMAELWMGAHPKASSKVIYNNSLVPLIDIIQKDPQTILGKEISKKFNNTLPYLFKILAAEKPLSIQAHPNKIQAKIGFERENKEGIGISAYNRSYKDDNHKPECICALTPFTALNGFRKIKEILFYIEKVSPLSLKNEIYELKSNPDKKGLQDFFASLIKMDKERKKLVIKEAISRAKELNDPVFIWMIKLNQEYQDDIGILSPILLNLISLKPGEALFLESGELHAYLQGAGIELMANSDNVLRGGLTPKYIDLSELINIVNFEEKELKILNPVPKDEQESYYKTNAEEFSLSVLSIRSKYLCDVNRSVEILICIEGSGIITNLANNEQISVNKGTSFIIPSIVPQYEISGNAFLYKASVPF
ncbi:MAG: mannose-6-phosphate isomerase, class I [Desulfobacterales bacterium]|nr:mannose-6-phosphate isomerase, class I [Desulfobacterales bacterium]MBF0395792.1 mannose-6-phosphate isomerase, class I [Desulfobacterales bacterium]